MNANLCSKNALRVPRSCAANLQSTQAIERAEVAVVGEMKNPDGSVDFLRRRRLKSNDDIGIEGMQCKKANQNSQNSFLLKDLRALRCEAEREKTDRKKQKSLRGVWFTRWLKFNFVGGIGIAVQFFSLFLLKSVFHFDYLFATAVAVETAVVHNFVWHEQFTWADRRGPSGAKAPKFLGSVIAALKRCATQKQGLLNTSSKNCIAQKLRHPCVARFVRFNLTTGTVSIAGNLALMKMLVGFGHMNYLVANGIAIALCSAANFVVSDRWVFGRVR